MQRSVAQDSASNRCQPWKIWFAIALLSLVDFCYPGFSLLPAPRGEATMVPLNVISDENPKRTFHGKFQKHLVTARNKGPSSCYS